MQRQRRFWYGTVGMALGGVSLALLGLELVFRLSVGRVEETNVTLLPNEVLRPTDFPGLRFVFRPGATFTDEFGSDPREYFEPGAKLTYRINSLGFRGEETTLEKPPGRTRIVAVGDSVLFGSGVRAEDVMTAVLERGLNAAGVPSEVLNFGVPSFGTLEESVLLRRIAFGYQPDLAFFLFFLNDAGGGPIYDAFNALGEECPLRRISVLYDHLASRRARSASIENLVRDYHKSFEENARLWLVAQDALEKAQTAAERRGVPLVLVIFPLLYRLDEDYPFASIHVKVARRGRELGYHVLDLLPAFLGQDGRSLWVHSNNQHPNEEGHAIAARAIQSYLLKEGLVPR